VLRLLLLIGLVVVGSGSVTGAQSPEPDTEEPEDAITAIAGKWDIDCRERGCIMFKDLRVGSPSDPFDPDNPLHVTLAVAIDRGTEKLAFVSIQTPPNADFAQGIFVVFMRNKTPGWASENDLERGFRVPFEKPCSDISCTARIIDGMAETGDERGSIDMLEKMLNSRFLFVSYMEGEKLRRANEPLFTFQRDVKKAKAELKK
jgi:hypothetical protein